MSIPSACPIGESYQLYENIVNDGFTETILTGIALADISGYTAILNYQFSGTTTTNLVFSQFLYSALYLTADINGNGSVLIRDNLPSGESTQYHSEWYNTPLTITVEAAYDGIQTVGTVTIDGGGITDAIAFSGAEPQTNNLDYSSKGTSYNSIDVAELQYLRIVGQNLPNQCTGPINTITYNGKITSITPDYPIKSTMDLGLLAATDSLGNRKYTRLQNGLSVACEEMPFRVKGFRDVVDSEQPEACPIGETYLAKGVGDGYESFVLGDFTPSTGVAIDPDGSAVLSNSGWANTLPFAGAGSLSKLVYSEVGGSAIHGGRYRVLAGNSSDYNSPVFYCQYFGVLGGFARLLPDGNPIRSWYNNGAGGTQNAAERAYYPSWKNGTKVTVTVQQVSQTATTTTVNIKMEITATDGSDYDYIELLGVVYTDYPPGSYIGVDSPYISSRLVSYYAVGQNLPNQCTGPINTITYNGKITPITPDYPIKSTMDLGLLPATDSLGNRKYTRLSGGLSVACEEMPFRVKGFRDVVDSEQPEACPIGETYLAKGVGGGYESFVLGDFTPSTGVAIDPDGSADVSGVAAFTTTNHDCIELRSTMVAPWNALSFTHVLAAYTLVNTGVGLNISVSLSVLAGETGWAVSYRGNSYLTPRHIEWSSDVVFVVEIELAVTNDINTAFRATITGAGIVEEVGFDFVEAATTTIVSSRYSRYIGTINSLYTVGQNLPQTCQGYHHSRDLDRYTTGEDFDETGAHPLLSCVNGVYPFGPLFDASSVEVSPVYDNRGHADFYGAITKYKGGFAPVGALVENDFAETSCTAENWVLNGVGLPFPEDRKFLPSVTSSTKVSQNFGATLDTQGIARTHGDTTKVTLMMDKVKAFELLKMLKDTDWETGPKTATFARSYKPFGQHRPDSCLVQILTSTIKVEQLGVERYKIGLSLQYQGA